MASRMRWSMPLSSARCCSARKLVDIEQRQRAAGDLLGAAERIAVERLEQRRGVERGRGPDRERHRAGARHQIGEQVVRQREALAPGERLHRAARQHLRRRLDVERVAALQREAAGPGDLHLRCRPRPRSSSTPARSGWCAAWPRSRSFCAGWLPRLRRAVGAHRDAVVAGRTFDVVELEMHGAAVASQQEARQRRGQHHRIAHGDVADWRGRPCPCSRPPP